MDTAAPALNHGPLAGVTVLDFTRVMSGPYCTMMLADMGARVIKIEHRGQGDDTRRWGPPYQHGESAYFLSVNRNKESVAIDFKTPDGRQILEALTARSDVLVENFRPGTLAGVGLDYASLSPRHPRLVYCSISGYGQTGPRRSEPGYDAVLQAEGGLMSVSGEPDGPPARLGVPIVDIAAGLFAAQGILLALIERHRSNRGQEVDVAMLDAAAALLTYQAGTFFATGSAPARVGNRHPLVAPYGVFGALDGDFMIGVGNDDQWRRLCEVAGIDALAADPRFATNPSRVERHDELRRILGGRLSARPRAYWLERLRASGVPCGSVRDLREVFADCQLEARGMITTLEHDRAGAVRTVGNPVKLSETPGGPRTAAPLLGRNTVEVLRHDLGLGPDDIERLRRNGTI